MRIPLNFAQLSLEISYVIGIGILFDLIWPGRLVQDSFFGLAGRELLTIKFSDNKRYGNGTVRIEVTTPFSSTISTDPAPSSSSVIFTHESKLDFDEHFIGNWSIESVISGSGRTEPSSRPVQTDIVHLSNRRELRFSLDRPPHGGIWTSDVSRIRRTDWYFEGMIRSAFYVHWGLDVLYFWAKFSWSFNL